VALLLLLLLLRGVYGRWSSRAWWERWVASCNFQLFLVALLLLLLLLLLPVWSLETVVFKGVVGEVGVHPANWRQVSLVALLLLLLMPVWPVVFKGVVGEFGAGFGRFP
jgi:hypothetical protein